MIESKHSNSNPLVVLTSVLITKSHEMPLLPFSRISIISLVSRNTCRHFVHCEDSWRMTQLNTWHRSFVICLPCYCLLAQSASKKNHFDVSTIVSTCPLSWKLNHKLIDYSITHDLFASKRAGILFFFLPISFFLLFSCFPPGHCYVWGSGLV